MRDTLLLLLGIAAAGFGGEAFVRGAVGVAAWARIPPGIIGATVAAFATSSPELSVAINSAGAGRPEIALGDAIGSNVVNIGLVLGLALLLAPGRGREAGPPRRDIVVALIAPLLTAVLAADGDLDRMDAVLLLALFVGWLTVTAVEARRVRSAAEELLGEHRHGRALLETAVGLALLVLAGRFIVIAAKGIGESLGWGDFVVGATLVAIGTSTPELATTLVSRLRGHDEVGLGTLLGSNIFNNLWIVGAAAALQPITRFGGEIVVGIVAGVVTVAALALARGRLGRGLGALLLACYVAYTVGLLTGF